MPRRPSRTRDELVRDLTQRRRLAAAELGPVVDRVTTIDRCLDALLAGTPIDACPLEDLDPNDHPGPASAA